NGTKDVIDRLLNLFLGTQGTIETPLPIDLDGEKYTMDSSLGVNEIIANAKNSIAWRYALREMNSFVVTDVSYANHNTDGSLYMYNPETGEGSMTEEYLRDRA